MAPARATPPRKRRSAGDSCDRECVKRTLTNIEDVKYFLTQQTEVSMPHAKKKPLYCSFCRRDENTVEKLIGGPGVYICDRCVGACNAILAGKPAPSFAGWDSLSDDELVGTLRPAQAALSTGVEQR